MSGTQVAKSSNDIQARGRRANDAEAEGRRIVVRLRRLEGQLKALERMIEAQAECEDVLTQFAAAKQAFQSIGIEILAQAVKRCVMEDASAIEKEALDRATQLLSSYARHLQ